MNRRTSLLKFLLLFLLTLPLPAQWTRSDTLTEAGYLTLHCADWAQTLQIADSGGRWTEQNVFLGRHPSRGKVNAYFAGTALAHVLIARCLPPDARHWFQGVTIGIEAGCVGNNYRIGIRFRR